MTRLPREGRNKTRLIPALGAKGAMVFHDRLARHAIGRASSFCMMEKGRNLRICLEGGTPIEGKSWLGDDSLDCREQSDGDLGTRMRIASEDAFADGAEKVVIVGTDCPSINESILHEAKQLLDSNDLVYGPALDGGYYLVGMRKPSPAVFDGISWGGENVLSQSLDAANLAGLKTALLNPLPDVDHPQDLPAAEQALRIGSSVSVIIPTFNEAPRIAETLASISQSAPHEIIVADGGSTDGTREIAGEMGARVISAPKGRGSQMNHGAETTTGEFLLFLHADTIPPDNFPHIIANTLNRPNTAAGAFRFKLSGDMGASPLIEALVNLRCRFFGTPYGDQGIFIRRAIFHQIGGFSNLEAMEDLYFIRKARNAAKIRIARESVLTSPRRWQQSGLIRTFLRHQLMFLFDRIGIPDRLISQLRQ